MLIKTCENSFNYDNSDVQYNNFFANFGKYCLSPPTLNRINEKEKVHALIL